MSPSVSQSISPSRPQPTSPPSSSRGSDRGNQGAGKGDDDVDDDDGTYSIIFLIIVAILFEMNKKRLWPTLNMIVSDWRMMLFSISKLEWEGRCGGERTCLHPV